MTKVELFFDYACPFCNRAFRDLMELLPDYPNIELLWLPCEAHPRPDDNYGKHSDLCIQGMFYAAENGVAMMDYHKKIFELYHRDKLDVENIEVLAGALKDLLDPERFAQALKNGRYAQALKDANAYAYKESGVWIIPAFRMESHRLVAEAGTGIPKDQLKKFFDLSN